MWGRKEETLLVEYKSVGRPDPLILPVSNSGISGAVYANNTLLFTKNFVCRLHQIGVRNIKLTLKNGMKIPARYRRIFGKLNITIEREE